MCTPLHPDLTLPLPPHTPLQNKGSLPLIDAMVKAALDFHADLVIMASMQVGAGQGGGGSMQVGGRPPCLCACVCVCVGGGRGTVKGHVWGGSLCRSTATPAPALPPRPPPLPH